MNVRVGGGVQAWFPLGPDEPYYPPYHHSDTYLRQVNVTNVRNVTVVNNIIVRNVTNVTYVNQRVAVTAVSSEAFRSSQPVARQVVAVRADEVVRARVIEHPEVQPDARAVVGGAVVTHPRVQVARPMMVQRTVTRTDFHKTYTPPSQGGGQQTAIDTSKAQHNNGGQPPSPQHTFTPPPQGGGQQQTNDTNKDRHDNAGQPTAPRTPAPVYPNPSQQTTIDTSKAQHNNGGQPASPQHTFTPPPQQGTGQQNTVESYRNQHNNNPVNAPVETRPLVTKTPPPPPPPSFDQKKDAMQSHPGRPLEPQQVQNLQKGQPAGPMHDQETHQHESGQNKGSDQHGKDDHGKDDKKPH